MDFRLEGKDSLERKVYLAFFPKWSDLMNINSPGSPFIGLLVGDSLREECETLKAISQKLLQEGCVYFSTWGIGCSRFEDIIDDSIVDSDIESENSVIMTTSHPDESLEDGLEFVIKATFPDQKYSSQTKTVLVLCVENVNWFNIVSDYLEDALDDA